MQNATAGNLGQVAQHSGALADFSIASSESSGRLTA
jgi:hypothetical protein